MSITVFLFIAFLALNILAFLPNPSSVGGVPGSVLLSTTLVFGFHLALAIVAGFFNISITEAPWRFVAPIAVCAVVVLRFSIHRDLRNLMRIPVLVTQLKNFRIDDASLVFPSLYLALVIKNFTDRPYKGLTGTLNHIDVATNSGLFTFSGIAGQMNISQEVYPRAPHQIVASALSVVREFTDIGSMSRYASYIFFEQIVILMMILSIGVLTNYLLRGLVTWRLLRGLLVVSAQCIIFVGTAGTTLVFSHGLSMMTGIAVTLVIVYLELHLLELLKNSLAIPLQIPVALACGFLVLGFSYPLLVLVLAPSSFYLSTTVLIPIIRSAWGRNRAFTFLIFSLIVLVAFPGAIYASKAWSQLMTRSTFTGNGAIQTMNLSLFVGVALVSLAGLLICVRSASKSQSSFLTLYFIGCIATVTLSWFIAGNFNREYGPNYYPKKTEWMIAVLLLPVCYVLLGKLSRLKIVTFLVVGLCLGFSFSDFLDLTYYAAPTTSHRQAIMRLMFQEADKEGTVLMAGESEIDSIHASVLSNTLDFSYQNDKDSDGAPTVPEMIDGSSKTFRKAGLDQICGMIWRGSNQTVILDGKYLRCNYGQ